LYFWKRIQSSFGNKKKLLILQHCKLGKRVKQNFQEEWEYHTLHHENISPHVAWDNELINVFIYFCTCDNDQSHPGVNYMPESKLQRRFEEGSAVR
jgi:hypothetical protein